MVSTGGQDSLAKRGSNIGRRPNAVQKMISSNDEVVGDENMQPNHYFDANANGQSNMFSNHLALGLD